MQFFRLVAAIVFIVFALAQPVSAELLSSVRVGIITTNPGSQYRDASIVSFGVKGGYQVIDLSAVPGSDIIATPAEGDNWQVYYLDGGMQIYQNGQLVKVTAGPVVVREVRHASDNRVCLTGYTSAAGTATTLGKWYRGNMEFRSTGANLVAINELPLEEYICGVVPREMSNSWPLEALKAQAVGARTYIAANFGRRVVEGYNVLDTPADQAYGGFNSEGANCTRAVQETAGQIVTYGGKPISAVYHSNSGGHTEDNENVWAGPQTPYLRGKPDPYSLANGLANWTFTTSIDDVRNKLTASGSQIGPVKSIELVKFSSGRVKTVMITDINGNTISKGGAEFGKLFNPKFYTTINNTSFMSNFFSVKMDQVETPKYYVLNSTGQSAAVEGAGLFAVSGEGAAAQLNGTAPDFYAADSNGTGSFSKSAAGQVLFEGHGWGHGVGMSQWGAYEMAKQGKSFTEILKLYYTGVEIGPGN